MDDEHVARDRKERMRLIVITGEHQVQSCCWFSIKAKLAWQLIHSICLLMISIGRAAFVFYVAVSPGSPGILT